MIFALCILAAAIALGWYFLSSGSKPRPGKGRTAPGPPQWPIVGNAFQVDFENLHLTFHDWKLKYGNVVSSRFFSRPFVILSSWDAIKDSLIKQADNFAARPQLFVFDSVMDGKRSGLINNDGWKWKEQRNYALKILSDFGLGKSTMEEKINFEMNELFAEFDRLAKENPGGFDVVTPTRVSMANVTGNVLMSKRHAYDDDRIIKFLHANDQCFENLTRQLPLDFLPALRPLLPIFPGLFKQQETERLMKYCSDYIQEIIEDHRRTLKEDQQNEKPSDYIYAYLAEMEKREKAGDQEKNTFTHHQLVWNLRDIYIAGFETIATTVNWFYVYVCHWPEVLFRIRDEVMRETGGNVTWADRHKCHYTMSCMTEVQRYANIGPLGVFHSVFDDTTVQGYSVNKGDIVVTNIWSVMRDPDLFPEPDKFLPDRFLDSDGKFTNPSDGIMPFSAGRRICLGADMARMELFLFLAGFSMKYEIRATTDGAPSMADPVTGHTLAPKPYKVRLVKA